MSTLAVSTEGLTKRFGHRTVVDRLALAIPTGSVCGFVGPNGAGKTTTIRILLGLVDPTSGSGRVLGGDLTDPASYLGRVGALIEAPAFYPQLTGRDNLRCLARLGGLPMSAVGPALDRVGLAARAGDRYRMYSLGMKQRLGIAAALLPGPELLILDEPTNGLDPAGIVEMRGLIRSLAGDGVTVLVSSHLIAEIEHICDHVVVIRDGRLVHQGPAAELRQGADLAIRPENPADNPRLLALLQAAGLPARTAGDDLVVEVATGGIGRVNRMAMDHGIVLVHLAERQRSLEDAFFALTDAGPAGDDLGAVA
ncbi:MAG TPA: ABC transporter ATP-binding protein [Acidimicrobiales bacterium]|jgi:ABC-2 type transport system ATP-binding protein|nr:ABC transporter ATP-binding protein [Acidimicrobiales bacterium]